METTWILLAAVAVLVLSLLVYMRASFAAFRAELESRAMALQSDVEKHIKAEIPQMSQLLRDLKSTQGKAMRTVRKAKEALGARADDDDLIHSLATHPVTRGILEGANIDPDAVARGDPEALEAALGLLQGPKDETAKVVANYV